MRILPNIAKQVHAELNFLNSLTFRCGIKETRNNFFFVFAKSNPRKKFIHVRYKKYYLIFDVVDEENIGCLPAWAAFNSLVTDSVDVSICQGIPLYPGSPTDWANLHSALKMAQGINVAVTSNKKTIITLDLQLYSKAMQLREKSDINEEFIFRLGELHIVFAMLNCIGKYI